MNVTLTGTDGTDWTMQFEDWADFCRYVGQKALIISTYRIN